MVNMTVDKISPDDPRITHKYTTLNGRKYHYILALPEGGDYRATIFLIHGFPDLSFAWRYQIPALTKQGLRVIAPDMMGYGQTEAPDMPPETMHIYGLKRAADDIEALAKEIGASEIILGGHDWGGMITYRCAQWKPRLVTHVIVIATPYGPKSDRYVDAEAYVKQSPQFGYQLQFKGSELKNAVQTRHEYQQFFKALYNGKSQSGKPLMVPQTGVDLELLKEPIGDSPLVDAAEINYYVDQFMINGIDKPLNWYRNRLANFEDEKKLNTIIIQQPTLFILAARDDILTRDLTLSMGKFVPDLTRHEVNTSHWALWQAPAEINGYIKDWLGSRVFGIKSSL